MLDWIELIHRVVGYPAAFLAGPAALLAFARPPRHRWWGRVYVYLMVFLYASGTWMTLARHDWGTWQFARNATFNLFGFSMLLHAYRAIHLFRHPALTAPAGLDRALAALQGAVVLAVLSVAVFKDTPMRAFAAIGLLLCILDWRELSARFQPRVLLFRRHVRYILASYFYVLTLVSIVHLDGVLPRNVKWLWPAVVGVAVITLATGDVGRLARGRTLRWSIAVTLGVALALGAFVAVQLARGVAVGPQARLAPVDAGGRPAAPPPPVADHAPQAAAQRRRAEEPAVHRAVGRDRIPSPADRPEPSREPRLELLV
jgi:hypothetical protein